MSNLNNKLKMDLQFFAEDPIEPTVDPVPEIEEPITPEPEVVEPIVEEPIEPEVITEPNTEELEALKVKLAEAQSYKAQYEEAQAFKEKYEKAQTELQGYEESLSKIAESKIEALPEAFKALVPEGSTQEKLDWLAKAEASGVLITKEVKSIGGSAKTNQREPMDLEEMSATQKMVAGIKEHYARK